MFEFYSKLNICNTDLNTCLIIKMIYSTLDR